MAVSPGDTLTGVFSITNAAGTAVAPDALPVAEVWKNNETTADEDVIVTVTPTASTGVYGYSFVVPLTYIIDDSVTVMVTALVAGVGFGPLPVDGYIVDAAEAGASPPPPPSGCATVVAAGPGCTPYGSSGDIYAAVLRYGSGGQVTYPLVTPYGSIAVVGENCAAPNIQAGMSEVVGRCTGTPLEASVTSDGTGLTVTIPADTAPGIYQVEALLSNDVPQVRATVRGLLYVEPSYVFGPSPQTGLPSVDDIRQALRDNPASRRLLGAYEFSVSEIGGAVRRAVSRFNAHPPLVSFLTTSTWPMWATTPLIDGVVAELFEMSAAYFRANALPYSAGGISVDDTVKEKDYLAAAREIRQRWDRWCTIVKTGANIEAAYGSSASYYYTPNDVYYVYP